MERRGNYRVRQRRSPNEGTAARCSRKEMIDHARVRGDEGAVQGDGRAIKRSDETTSNDE